MCSVLVLLKCLDKGKYTKQAEIYISSNVHMNAAESEDRVISSTSKSAKLSTVFRCTCVMEEVHTGAITVDKRLHPEIG